MGGGKIYPRLGSEGEEASIALGGQIFVVSCSSQQYLYVVCQRNNACTHQWCTNILLSVWYSTVPRKAGVTDFLNTIKSVDGCL